MQLGEGVHGCGGAHKAPPGSLPAPVRAGLLKAEQDTAYGCSKRRLQAYSCTSLVMEYATLSMSNGVGGQLQGVILTYIIHGQP